MLLEFKKWIENIASKLADDLGLSRGDYGKSQEEKGRFVSDLYHMDDFGDEHNKIWVWWWDGYQLYASKGGTHGSKFGHDVIGAHFKGRYSDSVQTATVTGGEGTGRVVSEDELIKMFPEEGVAIVNALYRRFPKLKKIVGIV